MNSELTNDTGLGSEEFKKGAEAWIAGDIAAAEKAFSKSAQSGNTKALYWLGRCYDDPRFVDRNPKKSCEFFKQAAEAGYEPAYLEVADRLLIGQDIEKNVPEAAKFLSLALEKGLVADDCLLYFLNSSERKIASKAIGYLEKSEGVYPHSYYHLAWLYLEGEKIPPSNSKAYQFFARSAQEGYLPSQVFLAIAKLKGTLGVEKNFEKGFQALQELSSQGEAEANCSLGFCYWLGLGCERSEKLAAESWERAAQLNRRYIAYWVFMRILEGKSSSEELLQVHDDFKNATEKDTWAQFLFKELEKLKIWETIHKNGILSKFTAEIKQEWSKKFEQIINEKFKPNKVVRKPSKQ